MKTIENTNKTLDFIMHKYMQNELDDDSLVQIIELCGKMLDLKSIAKCALDNKKSYNGIKKTRKIVNLLGNKWVIDNYDKVED
jgi:hypothetical protein